MKKFEESEATCMFLAKCTEYMIIGKNRKLAVELDNSYIKATKDLKCKGFNGFYYKASPLAKKICKIFPNVSRIYCLPFCHLSVTPKAKRAYQRWCKYLCWIEPATAKIICDEVDAFGFKLKEHGKMNWMMLKEDNHYIPIITELKFMIYQLILRLSNNS